ncbi:Cystathionine beta-lyase family protein involved in aluminum resistance [Sulfobacillus thermosulfidooxidans DSM 9293]|uniref:Cystathionine beta-lyase family protein involved in aluminum resistance n=2 Tax=Sulfobacillus thermosulfidooxidans TaxID=28034 RepID=A0A1W1WLE8_SULTA|nr:methionine gamma-lyase family protein [Sulfobacillus thermosulfidooxidans]PSR29741.1 MAG: aluminum resistance protein [Sulfobacillus thermosulfidooxidans]SMC07086.1 Cystathionine beta-lyase family protein involved in aluminum resistance [Sulfobacillus thermosulfidooxidans DSM 9293]
MQNPDILKQARQTWLHVEAIVAANVTRVAKAFSESGLSTSDLGGSTGYGYGDRGRERLDQIVATIMHAEAAMVRPQWASGTHALATALRALLSPGDHLWLANGPIYDTLQPLIFGNSRTSLPSRGIDVSVLPTDSTGMPIWPQQAPPPRVVYIQRSRGYQSRPSFHAAEIRQIAEKAHSLGAWLVVDNCYGEFTLEEEPTDWGADLIVGSLLKNPGGGVAPTGAYVAGKQVLVEAVGEMLLAPGIGHEVGPTGSILRLIAQGWFLAPMMVGEALMGGIYASHAFAAEGFAVDPLPEQFPRSDIVTAIRLGDAQKIEILCRAVQRVSPIDGYVVPEAWSMPGYADPVIMAAGGFVAGGSLELSCDAPIRPPYIAYLQGGLSKWHTVMAVDQGISALKAANKTHDLS